MPLRASSLAIVLSLSASLTLEASEHAAPRAHDRRAASGDAADALLQAPVSCRIDNGGCGDPLFFSCTDNRIGPPSCAESPDLVLFYPFDAPPREPWVKDLSAYRNHANVLGDPVHAEGGLVFTEADALDAGNDRSLQFRESFTVAFWMSPAGVLDHNIHLLNKGPWAVLIGPSAQQNGYRLAFNTVAEGDSIDPSRQHKWAAGTVYDALTPGWVHVAVSYEYDGNAATKRAYLDGLPLDSTAVPGTFVDTATGLRLERTNDFALAIGKEAGKPPDEGFGFSGVIDDLYIFRRALTPSEILRLSRVRDAAPLSGPPDESPGRPDPADATTYFKIRNACAIDTQWGGTVDPLFGTRITRVSGVLGEPIVPGIQAPNGLDIPWQVRMRHLYLTDPEWNADDSVLAVRNWQFSSPPIPPWQEFIAFVDTRSMQTRHLIHSTEDERIWLGRWHPHDPNEWLYTTGPELKTIRADIGSTESMFSPRAPRRVYDFSNESVACVTPKSLSPAGFGTRIDQVAFRGKSSFGNGRIPLIAYNAACNTPLATGRHGPTLFSSKLLLYDLRAGAPVASHDLVDDCGLTIDGAPQCFVDWDTLRFSPDGRFISIYYLTTDQTVAGATDSHGQMRVFEVIEDRGGVRIAPVQFAGDVYVGRRCGNCSYGPPSRGFLPFTGETHPVLTARIGGFNGIVAGAGRLYGLSPRYDLGRLIRFTFEPDRLRRGIYRAEVHSLSDGWGEAESQHVSVAGQQRSDWMVVSYDSNRPTRRFNGEVVLVNIASGAVRRLLQHRSDPIKQQRQPTAAPSRRFDRVVFGSTWDRAETPEPAGCPQDHFGVKTFVADLPR
jgi:hypothetical protein